MDKKKREVIEWLLYYAVDNLIPSISLFNVFQILFPNDLTEISKITIELRNKEHDKKIN